MAYHTIGMNFVGNDFPRKGRPLRAGRGKFELSEGKVFARMGSLRKYTLPLLREAENEDF